MNRPLWVDPEERAFPPLQVDRSADVTIVGAGFSGLGAAWALAATGMDVVVLEGRSVAAGASGRNAGFLLAGPAMPYDQCVAQVGDVATREIWELTIENHRVMAGLIEEHGIECGFLRRGSMSLAVDEAEWEELCCCYRALAPAGINVCLAGRHDLPRPFDRLYAGGLYYAGNGELNPGGFLRGLASRLSGHITIYEGSEVAGLQRQNGSWKVRSRSGTVSAATVLITTNGYTSRLLPELPVAPKRGQVLATAPLDRVIVPFPMYASHGYQYWRQTAEGRLVVGGWRDMDMAGEVGHDERLHGAIQPMLTAFAESIAGLRTEVEYRWAGIMGFTPDMMPLAGHVPTAPGVFVAAGYSGHGVAMAFMTGARVASMISGGEGPPRAFDPGRFEVVAGGSRAAARDAARGPQ
jgi:gamma-glutamylputrescine oxidase